MPIISATSCRAAAKWCCAWQFWPLLIAIGDAVSWLAGRSVVDRFQTDIYQAANSVGQLPLLLAAVTVLIPIGEETLFRGFLMRGWLRSPRRPGPSSS